MNSAKSDCQDAIDSINPLDEAWDEVEGARDWIDDNILGRRKKREIYSLLPSRYIVLFSWLKAVITCTFQILAC